MSEPTKEQIIQTNRQLASIVREKEQIIKEQEETINALKYGLKSVRSYISDVLKICKRGQ